MKVKTAMNRKKKIAQGVKAIFCGEAYDFPIQESVTFSDCRMHKSFTLIWAKVNGAKSKWGLTCTKELLCFMRGILTGGMGRENWYNTQCYFFAKLLHITI